MKRYVKNSKEDKYAEVDAASKFKRIDSVRFAGGLFRKLQEYYDPEDKRIQISPQYTEITISDYNPTSDSAWGLLDHVEMALESMGYNTYYVDADEYPYIAAIKGEAWVKIYWDYTPDADNIDTMYLDFSYDNGNVIFEDWYDDYEVLL